MLVLLVLLGLLGAVGIGAFTPPPTPEIPAPRPAITYAEAVGRVAQLRALDGPEINPVCRSLALLQPEQVERAVVLFHGFTNCPEQFRPLAELLHQQGYSVLVVRYPYHGHRDRLTPAPALLTADQLSRQASDAVDIARGLGRKLSVAGISLGGVMTAWLALNRADVDRAFVLAPSLGSLEFPDWLNVPVSKISTAFLQDEFRWWDDRQREAIAGPQYAYPRFSVAALGEISRLSIALLNTALPPKAGEIWFVTNGADRAIDNRVVYRLRDNWKAQGANVRAYEFPLENNLLHDLIDQNQVGARTDLVYAELLKLFGQ